ncbi:MAG: recombination protein O N-terminal domain-containing protein [Candidatus Kaiserbacteria bacterium]|nr:MAG: recombination protein O N-terminal domain-containing protein [Candidatus Kaiserbacteria bacterium]
MYQKYSTEALVLRSRESGESDRVFTLYTKDFGLVRARASAVRAESSRMRYALQSLSLASVSLVKGKRGWRVAGAAAIQNAPAAPKSAGALARIADLTVRLTGSGEANVYLYATLSEAHQALKSASEEIVPTIEIISVARLLYALGYLSAEALDTALLTHTAYDLDAVSEGEQLRQKLLDSINRALPETQL